MLCVCICAASRWFISASCYQFRSCYMCLFSNFLRMNKRIFFLSLGDFFIKLTPKKINQLKTLIKKSPYTALWDAEKFRKAKFGYHYIFFIFTPKTSRFVDSRAWEYSRKLSFLNVIQQENILKILTYVGIVVVGTIDCHSEQIYAYFNKVYERLEIVIRDRSFYTPVEEPPLHPNTRSFKQKYISIE